MGPKPAALADAGRDPGTGVLLRSVGLYRDFLSGPALAADHRRHGGRSLRAIEIATLTTRGDAECAASLGRYMDRLARGLASMINLIDPMRSCWEAVFRA